MRSIAYSPAVDSWVSWVSWVSWPPAFQWHPLRAARLLVGGPSTESGTSCGRPSHWKWHIPPSSKPRFPLSKSALRSGVDFDILAAFCGLGRANPFQ